MSDNFSGIEAFVAVAEEGAFRGAAARLGLTPSAVSRAVATLEGHLNVRLLNRTTRFVGMTPEGELYYAHAKAALIELLEGRRLIEMSHGAASGVVTVSLSPVLAPVLTARLPMLREKYPSIELHLDFTDEYARLADDQVDIAIRMGELEDSTLIARLWFRSRWVVTASRGYLDRYGTPRYPSDLVEHTILMFRNRGAPVQWTFTGDSPELTPACVTTLGAQLIDMARQGVGLCQAFDFMVREDLDRGSLVEVLAPFSAAGATVWALTRHQTQRVQAVLEVLLARD